MRQIRLISYLLAAAIFIALVSADSLSAKADSKGQVIELDEDNWHLMLNGEWMIEFFAPWCPACKNLAPTWGRFARTAKDVNVQVAKIDVTTSPSLSGRFFVTALPTIYHVKDGEFRQYRGARDGDALFFFIKKQQWESIEPLSAWKKPDTIHMSVLSYFFKLSHTLKDLNGRLQEEYGLPTWGSYALFAIATVFVGAALGLFLVCLVDFIYPPKKVPRKSFSESQDNLADGVEDLATEEIEDDDEAQGDAVADGEVRDSDENEENETEETQEDESKGSENESEKSDVADEDDKQVGDGPDEATEKVGKPITDQVRKRKPRKAD